MRAGAEMEIHGMCLVKNEADIIEQTLRAAARWCDHIYVLDNGSSDGTWEKVQELACELGQVVPYKQDRRPFSDALRTEIMRHYAGRAKRGDWWCVIDADELCIDDPRVVLGGTPKRYKAVWMLRYSYLFTEADLATYHADPSAYDGHRPMEEVLRHYQVAEYTEARFWRHSTTLPHLSWSEVRPVAPVRMRMKHFAYRSPEQMEARIATRREPMLRGEFVHEKRSNWVLGGTAPVGPASLEEIPSSWRERVTPPAECHVDLGDGVYAEAPPWAPPPSPAPADRLLVAAGLLRRRVRHAAAARLRRRPIAVALLGRLRRLPGAPGPAGAEA